MQTLPQDLAMRDSDWNQEEMVKEKHRSESFRRHDSIRRAMPIALSIQKGSFRG